MPERKFIDWEHYRERVAIKLEPIRNPTEKQIHDAENETLLEFRELYGQVSVEQWPRMSSD
jgi:hypothetical protein